MQGRIKVYNEQRKFGFVETEAGDFFFHFREVIGELQRGDIVTFWLDDSPLRDGQLEAVEIRRLVNNRTAPAGDLRKP